MPHRLGGAGLMCFAAREEPVSVLYRLGAAGFCTSPLVMSRLLCFTAWEEPAHVLYRLG